MTSDGGGLMATGDENLSKRCVALHGLRYVPDAEATIGAGERAIAAR